MTGGDRCRSVTISHSCFQHSRLADRAEVPLGEIRERIAVSEKLTDREVSEKLPSGRQTVLSNRVGWALLGMERAGLVERVRRAVYRLTDEGGQLLARGLERVDDEVLATYPAFAGWKKRQRQPRIGPPYESRGSKETPEETLTRAAGDMCAMLEAELLDRVRGAAPAVLEHPRGRAIHRRRHSGGFAGEHG